MKTIMNKLYYISIVLFFCSLALPVRGQKALDETIQKNVSLEKELELFRKDSSQVKNSIKNKLLQIEKDSLKYKELNGKYNSLLSLTSQDSIIALRQYVELLECRQKSLQSIKDSLDKEICDKKNELRNADSKLQDMNVYSDLQKQQLYQKNNLYLTKRYSIITIEKLTELSNSLDEFSSCEGFVDYKNRIFAAINNKRKFDEAWDCLCVGTGYQDADKLRLGISTLLEIKKDDSLKGLFKLSEEQYNEVDSLDIRLSRYNSGIRELKKIVEEINNDEDIVRIRSERKSSLKRDCLDLIKRYIIPKEGCEYFRIYQRYFLMIPYLEKLLKDYWNELKKNPFDIPTKSEKIIINLITI